MIIQEKTPYFEDKKEKIKPKNFLQKDIGPTFKQATN